ncbi:branched-subunit amino acid ABC-type transport system permease component [Bradyrhizobium sp. LM6.10]
MSSWLDYTINGLIVGNVYALVAVGLALIFGVSRLINFAQGSIYLVGAYIGWVAVVQLHTPLPLTIILVAVAAALVGLIIERFGLRPLQNSVRIAPLLATIGISFVLDQLVMLTFSPNPRALPSQLPGCPIPGRRRHDRPA